MTQSEFKKFTVNMVFIDKNGFFAIPTGIMSLSIHYFYKAFNVEKQRYMRHDSVCSYKDANLINQKNMELIKNKIKKTHRDRF